MSMEDARDFLQGAWADEKLRVQLKVIGAMDEESAFAQLLVLAAESGFHFDREEFRRANQELRNSSLG